MLAGFVMDKQGRNHAQPTHQPRYTIAFPWILQVVKVGNAVYIAGQVSAGADGNVVGKGDPVKDEPTSVMKRDRFDP